MTGPEMGRVWELLVPKTTTLKRRDGRTEEVPTASLPPERVFIDERRGALVAVAYETADTDR